MSLRILLADESSTIKKAFEIGLNSFGAEIKNVQHGIDVLEVAEHFKPDIIFADVLISKMNGYAVCSQIKQHPTLSGTPVVLMWSGFMDIDEDKYYTCQADGKIEKPFSADQLMSLIQNLVQKPIGERQSQSSQQAKVADVDAEVTPPPLPKRTMPQTDLRPSTSPSSGLKAVPKVNPTDDLLYKEDLPDLEDSDELDLDTLNTSDDDFGIDGFQALDLHDDSDNESKENLNYAIDRRRSVDEKNSIANFDFSMGSNSNPKSSNDLDMDELDDSDEFREITQIPTAEEEAHMLAKVNEDSSIRHGHGFLNSDMQDELSNPGVDFSQLTKDLENHKLIDFTSGADLNTDIFGEEMNPDSDEFVDMFSAEQKNSIDDPNTIHRDVEDLHNSDMGMLNSSEDLMDLSAVKEKSSNQVIEIPKNGVQALTKEEIKAIIQEQAKDVIQSIVWELIPEMSKQLIEKEIKRLLADSDSTQS